MRACMHAWPARDTVVIRDPGFLLAFRKLLGIARDFPLPWHGVSKVCLVFLLVLLVWCLLSGLKVALIGNASLNASKDCTYGGG